MFKHLSPANNYLQHYPRYFHYPHYYPFMRNFIIDQWFLVKTYSFFDHRLSAEHSSPRFLQDKALTEKYWHIGIQHPPATSKP
ncbi:hypothetical protein BKP37_07020 [Anaerobacillus alkalilacustris]|uniref:Uncharacterized protein n=1 Tax=Anaerobacillus alkalilacustris TaxID=393763 RepID=A0A1S2LQY1_9BACI|nr:hypothetical protein [Anaerobacillus alkalilacustris]OIJ14929.1 hypothetical protein BKP37_07020 [Anaerobacillus alkalilacustris]